MSRRLIRALAFLALVALPGRVAASGAWTTMLHAARYTGLEAEGDTVWCATGEAGLLEFSSTAGAFVPHVREPGGLASNQLTALAFDASRRLWVGTAGAGASVLSADRSSWGLLSAFDGLPSDTITVFAAAGDTVWIGTSAGIALWNGQEISGVLPDGTNPSPFANNHISGLAQFEGYLWVGTGAGVYRSALSSGLASWTLVNGGLPATSVDALATDGETLMALSNHTVERFDASSGQWTSSGVPGQVFRLSGESGVLTAAGRLGLFRWTGGVWDSLNAELVSGATPGSTFVVGPAEGGRFFAAAGSGLYRQPAGPGSWDHFVPLGPPGNSIVNVDLDGSRLYVATESHGFGRFDGAQWKFWPKKSGATTSDTTFRNVQFPFAMIVDRKGVKWVACWESAIESFEDDVSPPRFTHTWSTTPGGVCTGDTLKLHTLGWGATLDSTGGHWFGMDQFGRCSRPAIGLDYFDSAGVYVTNYRTDNSDLRGNQIHALTTARNGRVWIGYSGQGIDYTHDPPVRGAPLDLQTVSGTEGLDVVGLAAHDDIVWAFTSSQVLRYDISGGFEASYSISEPASPLAIRPVAVAPDGTAWIGTASGIQLYGLDGSFQTFTTQNSPLAADDVRAIRIDPATNAAWIATAGGLNRYQIGYVPPPAPQLPRLEFHVYPNPARLTGLGIALRLAGNAAAYRGSVYDLGGRRIANFAAGANGQVIWNGRDSDGRLVRPGIYLVRAEAGGRSGTVRVALVR